jgi:hypothetical protein
VPPGGLILGVNGRHPHDLASRAPGDLDGNRVQAANAVIQGHRPEGVDPGNRLRHHLRTLAGLNVVGFQNEASHPVGQEFPRAIDIVNPPANDIGPNVDLKVVCAFQAFPGCIGNADGFLG